MKERQKLAGLSGPAFDREFARYMVKDHKDDISDFSKAAASGDAATAASPARTSLSYASIWRPPSNSRPRRSSGSAPQAAGAPPFEDKEGVWQQEQHQGRAGDQAGDDGDRERLLQTGASADAERQRRERQDGDERGHQDRPQARVRRPPEPSPRRASASVGQAARSISAK